VTIEMCSDRSVVEPLLAQETHLSVSNTKIVHRDLECQPFFTDHIILVVPSDHPFAQRLSVRPAELLGQPFILREESSSTQHIVREGLAEHGITMDQLDVVMVVGNTEAIEMAVEHGLGIAFISRLAARQGLDLNRIAEIPVAGLALERPLYVVRNSRCARTPAQTRFWNFIQENRKRIVQTLGA
jgi:DNA-binding transcriptional LysR family regulator